MARRKRLTYANVASTLALLLAISGTAYAAATVTSKDIVNRTIQVKDISKSAVFGLLADGAVGYDDDAGSFSGTGEQSVATLNPRPNQNSLVQAKLWVRNDGGSAVTMYCRLYGGVTWDIVWASLAPSGSPGYTESMSFMLAEFFDSTEDIEVVCNPNGGTIHVFDLKIAAYETGGVRETAF